MSEHTTIREALGLAPRPYNTYQEIVTVQLAREDLHLIYQGLGLLERSLAPRLNHYKGMQKKLDATSVLRSFFYKLLWNTRN